MARYLASYVFVQSVLINTRDKCGRYTIDNIIFQCIASLCCKRLHGKVSFGCHVAT